jgi:hypothetical protein
VIDPSKRAWHSSGEAKEKDQKKRKRDMSRENLQREADMFGAREQGFTYPLATRVQGVNARAQEFTEDTVLTSINYKGALFCLKNPVHIGTRLRLVIDLPEKLAEDKNLKLVIKGRVARVEYLRESPAAQKLTLEFDSRYIITPGA